MYEEDDDNSEKLEKPTTSDSCYILRNFLHKLHYARAVYMSHEKTMTGLDLIDEWSYAHRVGNGMLGIEETERLIGHALAKMEKY